MLPLIVLPVTVRSPKRLKIPPPSAELPVVELPLIVLPVTVRSPLRL